MKLSLCASVLFALFCLLPMSRAQAKVKVNVTNCISTQKTIKVFIFNGDDNLKWSPRTSKEIKYGSTKSLKCDGQGKGRCKLNIKVVNGTAKSSWKNIDRNKYAKVTLSGGKVQITQTSSQPSCD